MTVTYPLALPSIDDIDALTWTMREVVAVVESPFVLTQQVQIQGPGRWEAHVDLGPMRRADAEKWFAFLAALRGPYGTFLLGDPVAQAPRGSAATAPGVPVVNGAGQSGLTLDVRGLPAGAAGYMLAGDLFQLGSGASARLHKLTEDADADTAGDATLSIWPKLRTSPGDGDALTLASCVGRFRLVGPTREIALSDAGGIYSIAFDCVEAL